MNEVIEVPSAVLQRADGLPVAVLDYTRPVLYAVEPGLFDALMDEISELPLHEMAAKWLHDVSRAVEVDLDAL